MSPVAKLLILGFVAGSLATVLFHQGLWWVFNQTDIIPADRPAWPIDPVPPFGIPSVIAKAFWGGLWGAGLTLVLGELTGAAYWTSWIVVGAVALTVVAFFVVLPIKGEAIPILWPRFVIGLLLNGIWGFGTAIFLNVLGLGRFLRASG